MVRLAKSSSGQVSWTHDVIYQYDYPDEYGEIIRGAGYWLDPIKYIGEPGIFYYRDGHDSWKMFNPKKHCFYCGKFVHEGTKCKIKGSE